MAKDILVSIWKRLLAFIIDLFIIEFVLLYPFTKIAEKAMQNFDPSFMFFQDSLVKLMLAVALIYVLYFTMFEYSLGQTIGKMLMKCSSVANDNKKMSFLQALGRNLFLVPVIPFVFLFIIDVIFILVKKTSLSEMLTKTKTIEGERWVKLKQQ